MYIYLHVYIYANPSKRQIMRAINKGYVGIQVGYHYVVIQVGYVVIEVGHLGSRRRAGELQLNFKACVKRVKVFTLHACRHLKPSAPCPFPHARVQVDMHAHALTARSIQLEACSLQPTVRQLIALRAQLGGNGALHCLRFSEVVVSIAQPLSSPAPFGPWLTLFSGACAAFFGARTTLRVTHFLVLLALVLVLVLVLVLPLLDLLVQVAVDVEAAARGALLLVLVLGNDAAIKLLLQFRVVDQTVVVVVVVCIGTRAKRLGATARAV